MCYSCSLPPQMPFSPCRIALSTWGVRTHASEPLDRYPTTYNSSSPGGGPQNPCFTLPCSHQFCPPFIWVKKGLCSAFQYALIQTGKSWKRSPGSLPQCINDPRSLQSSKCLFLPLWQYCPFPFMLSLFVYLTSRRESSAGVLSLCSLQWAAKCLEQSKCAALKWFHETFSFVKLSFNLRTRYN